MQKNDGGKETNIESGARRRIFGVWLRSMGLARVGYQVASVVGGGFTPFIAAALITYFAGNWHSVAMYLLAGCLISAITALLMKDSQRA